MNDKNEKKLHPDDILGVVIFAGMLAITFANVLSRFILHLGISWSEEIVTHFAVLLSGLGASQAVRNESHYDIPLLDGLLSRKASYVLKLIAAALNMLFCVYMAYAGVTMVIQQYRIGKLTTMLRWPEWVWGLAIPIGCGFMAFYSIVVMIRTVKRRKELTASETAGDGKEDAV